MRSMFPVILFALFAESLSPVVAQESWIDFRPNAVGDPSGSPIDLRFLNESIAGENGRIVAKEGRFCYESTGQPVRFWGVNGPPEGLDEQQLRNAARLLSKYGVNLIRVHTPIFTKTGETDWGKVEQAHQIVEAMKREGIYTHFSIYFPLWFKPDESIEWLEGYEGSKPAFASLMFNPEFQKRYRQWLQDLLIKPSPESGKSLADDPAVFGVEIQNEDSFFFWTFSDSNIPSEQLSILESEFAKWLQQKHGSLATAFRSWGGPKLNRDNLLDSGDSPARVAFRPLWNMANERTRRDQDTAEFLLEKQTKFYKSTYDSLRAQGFRGLIHASNWTTASPEVLGPLEKLSYMAGDFVDRHGYFDCILQGENAAWSIRDSYTFMPRSALRLDPGKGEDANKVFVHPVMDPHYNDKPSMISETTFTRPNRYRSEAAWYYAAYGALQGSDAIVHFAFDGYQWEVKPRFWMQPWTLATPVMMGQFPAAAFVYRRGLIEEAEIVAEVDLNVQQLKRLAGTPLAQDASFDELRIRDVPEGAEANSGNRLDPLLHYVGRSQVNFVASPSKIRTLTYADKVDRAAMRVTSETKELTLDYKQGILKIDAPSAQGVCGNLGSVGEVQTKDLQIESTSDLIQIVVIAMDGRSLDQSQKMLLQVMTEERATGFTSSNDQGGRLKIDSIGTDPWQYKEAVGSVKFRRDDAKALKVSALDVDGRRARDLGSAEKIQLGGGVIYYLIEGN